MQEFLTDFQHPVLASATTSDAGNVSGAISDLNGLGTTASPSLDPTLSAALGKIAQQGGHLLPTALIAGVYNYGNSIPRPAATHAFLKCGHNDPLAQELELGSWPIIFNNQPNDAIVPVTSQLNAQVRAALCFRASCAPREPRLLDSLGRAYSLVRYLGY